MRSSIVLAAALLVAGAAVAPPASAGQGTAWVPPPISDQVKIVKAMNAEAAKKGGAAHGAGCYSMYALRGHSEIVTVTAKRNVNPEACGSTVGFGVQVFRKAGSQWSRVAGTSGPPGSACTYVGKVAGGVKALLKKSGVCA